MFSLYDSNGKKDILILGKDPTDGLDDTRITAEAKSFIIFMETRNKFCLTLHYKRKNFFFVSKQSDDLSIQIKRLWNKCVSSVFGQCFAEF